MFWPEGLFIILGTVASFLYKAWLDLWPRKKEKLPHWREMDYYYLEALNELNEMCPTGTQEEKGLAQYLKFNDREDHERRLGAERSGDDKRRSLPTGGTISGGFTTLLSPGLSNALSGGLGGLGGGALANQLGLQQQQAALGLLAQQHQQSVNRYTELLNQQSAVNPFSPNNDINLLAQALRESKKLDS